MMGFIFFIYLTSKKIRSAVGMLIFVLYILYNMYQNVGPTFQTDWKWTIVTFNKLGKYTAWQYSMCLRWNAEFLWWWYESNYTYWKSKLLDKGALRNWKNKTNLVSFVACVVDLCGYSLIVPNAYCNFSLPKPLLSVFFFFFQFVVSLPPSVHLLSYWDKILPSILEHSYGKKK